VFSLLNKRVYWPQYKLFGLDTAKLRHKQAKYEASINHYLALTAPQDTPYIEGYRMSDDTDNSLPIVNQEVPVKKATSCGCGPTATSSAPVTPTKTDDTNETSKGKKKNKGGSLGSARGIETMMRSLYLTQLHLTSIVDNKASMMITINGLIEAGLVKALENPQHKRSSLMTLTAKGSKLFASILKNDERAVKAMFADIPDSDLAITRETLESLFVILKGDSK